MIYMSGKNISQKNTIEQIKVNGAPQTVTNKAVDISVPTPVIDLGEIDLSEYDDEIELFYNTLTSDGNYIFVVDDICYRVEVEAVGDDDDNKQVRQTMWTTEEGPALWFFRALTIEDGEVVDTFMNNYMTLDDGQGLFAGIYHQHVRVVNSSKTVWAYIETDLSYDNRNPAVIYADTTNNKNYIINCYAAVKSPLTRIVIVRELGDSSCIYQRSNTYSAGRVTWGDWYKFSGTAFTP